MTLVLTSNVVGQARGEPVTLPNRRRRLSTIVARHRPAAGRNFIVSVHRRGVVDQRPLQPSDATAKLRAQWSKTLVGPQDVVLITVVPGRGAFASIGLAIASIALIALAPVIAPLISGSLLFGGGAASGLLTTAIQAGMVVGGIGLAYAAQQASAAKNKNGTLYSVAGGGNIPKPGGRKPLIYGKCWTSPPLSQRDYFRYDGITMVLTKRMTLGLGKFQIHQIKVGDAVFWDEAQGGLVAPFNQPVAGTDPNSQTAIEFLYEQASAIAPGDAIASGDVAGQELPYANRNPNVTPWFRAQPQGVVSDQVLISRTYPAIYRTSSKGEQKTATSGALWMARRIDPDTGSVIGSEFELLRETIGPVISTTAVRRSDVINWPVEGAYEVQAKNLFDQGDYQQDTVTWDEMTALKNDVRIRPKTSEIVMRVRAGPGLTVTAFSDITVLATRIVDVWDGSQWTEQATSKAVWAYADLVRAEHGLALENGFDADKAKFYADTLTEADTFDGLLPEVAGFWEDASSILLPMRSDPIKVGAVHSFVRDEAQQAPRRVISRRQMIRDSGTATFKTKVEGSDVIVEFDREGDPKRPDEVRYAYGPQTRTPKRYKISGITDAIHALKHAKWLSACAVFRGAERSVTTEWDGRLVYPGDHILSDMWFLKETIAVGIAGANGTMLTLDCDANVSTDWVYGSIRTRVGKDWGIMRMRGSGARGLELHPDDTAALATVTGLSLSNVLARESQGPTTIVIGSLSEMQQTWVARSAIPADEDHVQIEMVRDDPRVWQILDETPIVPQPIGANPLDEPLIPQISVLHARCDLIETGIEVVWSVSQTAGARNYEAQLSYDNGATWEPLSPFGPASSGRAPLHQCDGPVTVQARAYGRTGLYGPWVQTTFTTQPPVVAGSLVDITTLPPIAYENLDDLVKAQIDRLDGIQQQAQDAAQAAQDALTEAVGRIDTVRKALAADPAVRQGFVDPLIQDLRANIDILTQSVLDNLAEVSSLRDQLRTAGLETIPSEGRVRFYAIEALQSSVGTTISNFSITVDALSKKIDLYGSVQTGDLSGLIQSITTVQTTLNALQGTISSYVTAAQFNPVASRLSSAEQTLSALDAEIQAKASNATVDAQGVRLTSAEQDISALSGRIFQAVQASSGQQIDAENLPLTLAQMFDYLQRQQAYLTQQVAVATTNIAANIDDQGRATAEATTALAVRASENAAAIVTSAKVAADANAATATLVQGVNVQVGANTASITALTQAQADDRATTASQFAGVSTRFASAEAVSSSIISGYTSADSALSGRIDSSNAAIGSLQAGAATEVQSRIAGDQAISSRVDSVSARAETANSGVSTVSQALASANASQASTNNDLYARSNAGTAVGRFGINVASAPSGVSVRLAAVASTDSFGQQRNAGWYLDLMPDGTSRFVVDANFFALTANGGLTYPFQFDGTTLTVPSLRVTQSAILPGAVNDIQTLTLSNVQAASGVNANPVFNVVPGSSYTFNVDSKTGLTVGVFATITVTATGGTSSQSSNANAYYALFIDGVNVSVGAGVPAFVTTSVAVLSSGSSKVDGEKTVFRSLQPGQHTVDIRVAWNANGAGSNTVINSLTLDIQVAKR